MKLSLGDGVVDEEVGVLVKAKGVGILCVFGGRSCGGELEIERDRDLRENPEVVGRTRAGEVQEAARGSKTGRKVACRLAWRGRIKNGCLVPTRSFGGCFVPLYSAGEEEAHELART